MKKNLLVVFAMLLSGVQIFANAVSRQQAETVALNFYKVQGAGTGTTSLTATLNYTQTETDGTIDFYVFDIAPTGGFVIVSAHDNSVPILGYNMNGSFNPNGQHTGIGAWMKKAAQKIYYAAANNLPADAHATTLWSSYARGVNPIASRSAVIGPLVATHWNQDLYYNQMCPYDATANMRTYTGCVATTMAQIMKYWNYPNKGTGSHTYTAQGYGSQTANFNYTYNWANMPNSSASITSPIDTLMYHCGVSVNMDYGTTGSGAQVLSWGSGSQPSAQHSFASYFYYNPATLQGVYLSQYTDADWITLMKSELNAGRVVQYIGDDVTEGGHTWVCDGYDNNNMLHMNWGWGGADDGYFNVANLNAGGANFNQNESALIGIEPLYPMNISVTASTTSICVGQHSTLSVQGPANATYTWTPSTGLSCTSCASPVATPSVPTLYTVTVDSSGVKGRQAVAVLVTSTAAANYTMAVSPSCSMPEIVNFTNVSANGLSYRWDFGDGTSATTTNATHIYHTQGTYTARLYATNACGVDSFAGSQPVVISNGGPISVDQNICAGGTAALSAITSGAVNWFDASLTNILAQTTSFTTPALSTTTTFYVDADISFASLAVGATNNTIGTGAYSTSTAQRGLMFNSSTDQLLVAVDVYSNAAGGRTFVLEDNTGNVVDSVTVNLTSGHQTVTLNFPFSAGTGLKLTTIGTCNLYYNSAGTAFPYTTNDGTVTVTGSTGGSSGTYYYFYNMKFQQSPCTTPLTPVTVYVLGTGGNNFTAGGNGSPTVSFTAADQTATSYSWDFGDGSAPSTAINPNHSYAGAGTYTVTLTISNGSCSETVTKTVSTVALGISDLSSFSALSVSPNPAREHLTVSLSSARQMENCTVSVSNLIGQTQISNNWNIANGDNKMDLDISGLSAGVYFINLQNGKEVVTRKFVKSAE